MTLNSSLSFLDSLELEQSNWTYVTELLQGLSLKILIKEFNSSALYEADT